MEQKNNSKNLLIGALDQAASGLNRFKKAQLEEIFDEVAEYRARGLSRKQIAAVLTQQGLPITEGVFASTMSRIMKERRERNAENPGEVTATEKKQDAKISKSESLVVTKPVAGKKVPELKGLEIRPDLSLDDDVYEQFRKKD